MMAPPFLHNMVMICIFILFTNFPNLVQSVDSEAQALKDFKANIVADPLMFLANWTNNSLVCYWKGITCTSHHVSYLDLSNAQLSGTISPQIGGLRYLRYLNLSLNQFSGAVPLQLSFCSLLRSINLGSNSLVGSLPEALGNWSRLEYLNISHNQLRGNIAGSVGDLSKLRILDLSYNILTGTIPASLSNCSLLNTLNLDANMLTGTIPEEFGRLQRLEDLTLGTLVGHEFDSRNFANMLSGSIPASLSNCSHLRTLSLNRNNLDGTIPDVWTNHKALQKFLVWQNNLTGTIPLSLTNCTQLLSLDLGNNQISGTIPHQLGYLSNLNALHLGTNLLQGPIPASLGNCSKLQDRLWLFQNNLSGHIPDSIWTLYSLSDLEFDSNRLVGELPPEVGNLTQLTSLWLSYNYFSGNLPSSLGQLKQLQGIYLAGNNFEGPIPETLGFCSLLNDIHLHKNNLNGLVPSSLGNLTQLADLRLSFNNLTGGIPNIFQNNLQHAYFQRNRLVGTVPSVARLSNLLELDLSYNLLYGAVPSLCASNLFQLKYLNISHNTLTASIPESLENCLALETLDLSSNNLSGEIPAFLGTMNNLIFLNLSNNMLSGPVPNAGVFLNKSEVYLDDNSGLCGNIVNKTCLNTTTTNNHHHHARRFHKAYIIYIVLGTLAILAMMTCILYLLWKYHPQATGDDGYSLLPRHMKFAKDELCMATNNFSDDNIVGTGAFSIVYKGIMVKEELIAVKKLTMTHSDQTKKSFFRELETLGKLRHRNLVNILGYCNTLDMMAIVLEFMPNGSLKDHLYKLDPILLDWKKRLNIAIGVAQGLLYLHHESREAIVHCDIKPENILLDQAFEAHIADFGIATLVDDGTLSSFRGSFGYMAPELSQGKPTPMSDVYSYGILLVELITRKRPTDKLFMEDDNMEKFLHRTMSNNLGMVVDEAISKDVFGFESILKVLEVSTKCLTYDPKSRPNIGSVLARLTIIRDENNCEYRKAAPVDVLICEPSPYPSTLTGSKGHNSAISSSSAAVVPR